MNISEESLKYISNVFIGDTGNFYTKKSGPKIFSFFNKYFGYNDSYIFGRQYPSRWNIVYNKLVELWNNNLFNDFLSKILSVVYLKIEYPEKTVEELANLSNIILSSFNKIFKDDGNRIVKFADRFKLLLINDDEQLLGEGGYACCYYIKSRNIVEKRLKEENYVDKSVIHRFRREFDITKSLAGMYGIINVYQYNEKELSYTMERGECDLYSYVINNNLDDSAKREIILQILYIISEVHKRDIIHRDLSPNNIFIIAGELKIADFGLGKDLNAFYSHQTMKTNSVGQYYYCDPRQFMKLKDGDKLSDIYSLGKIINFVLTKNPNQKSNKYYSVVEKATCDEKFRYKSVDEMIKGISKIDEIESNKEYENNFLMKIYNNQSLDENDIQYICSFDDEKMFKMIKILDFRTTFVSAAENELIDENMFMEKLSLLMDYCSNNRISYDDSDQIGYLGSTILLSKCSYVAKEIAIDFINIPLGKNRFDFMRMVKREIIGNIDPTLEEKIIEF